MSTFPLRNILICAKISVKVLIFIFLINIISTFPLKIFPNCSKYAVNLSVEGSSYS